MADNGNYKPKTNTAFTYGSSLQCIPTYSVVNARGAGYFNGYNYDTNIWYMASDSGGQYSLQIRSEDNSLSALYVTGFYYTEDVPTTTGGET